MRKTNSKEARRAVEAYVLEEVRGVLDRCDAAGALRPVDAAFQIMRDEMKFQSNERDGVSIFGVGLAEQYRAAGRYGYVAATDPYNVWDLAARVGCFECYYDGARDRVAEWLDQTPEEAARYSNDRAWNLYIHLSAQAFARLHDKENTPHTVKTSEFVELYRLHNGGHFFDRETLKFFGQTRKSFDITAFHSVKDHDGVIHDCYRVFGRGNIDDCKFSSVHYFDRVTLDEVHPTDDNEEVQ